MEYKSTLNLPSTSFPMKASLALNEPKTLQFWQDADIYSKIRKGSSGRPKYVLHDGPPYANGNIHIGHALNKILKDIIIRFKTMRGFDSPYIPGWDCHGLPVEHQLFKDLKISKEQISQLDFRKKAYDYAMRFVNIQKEEFKRLGIFGDWERPYLTLDKKYEYEIVRALGELVKKGFIYRGLKPVNWCPVCETALAEAEVDYEDKTSPSIYVKFKLLPDQRLLTIDYRPPGHGLASYSQSHRPLTGFALVIWTTTPWTLYANAAVAAHPDIQYAFARTAKGNLIAAKDLLASIAKDMGLDVNEFKIEKIVSGRDLEGLAYEHPFLKDSYERKVVLADYVSSEEGTGLVHTAPGHGQEDYRTGLKYNLPIIMPVDTKGRFDNTVSELKGEFVLSANKAIVDNLERSGNLLFFGQKQHSCPHCWRCKSPIIFRATKQWFIKIEHNNLRKEILKKIKEEIVFAPEAGRERIRSMIESRPDWCLSRQRYWGVPIPAARCLDCNEETLSAEVIENFSAKVMESGSDAWFSRDISDFIPKGFKCPNCKGDKFARAEDILDVWFDSGVSHRAVLMNSPEMEFPASLYLEGSDQHRGWFQASLISAMAIEGKPPFKAALTHGFVVDGEGKKMSKSQGNVISPQEIIKEYGADILRLWAASSNYNEDVRISKDILSRLTDAYRKIRNTMRFLLGNISDFSPESDAVGLDKMLEVDRFNLSCAYSLLEKCAKGYENFEFYKVYQEIYQFCILNMSNFYLDILKDRLYTARKDGLSRRSAQTALYQIMIILVKAVAPILPFTAEELWQHLKSREAESAHLSGWPRENKYIDAELENKWYNLLQFRAVVLKAIEEKRASGEIGSSLEAELIIGLGESRGFLKCFDNLNEVFIVSAVSLEDSKEAYIKVEKAKGEKCPRCWNYSQETGKDEKHPELCPKCLNAVANIIGGITNGQDA